MPRAPQKARTNAEKTASQNTDGAGTLTALDPRVVATPAVMSIAVSSESRATDHARPGRTPIPVMPRARRPRVSRPVGASATDVGTALSAISDAYAAEGTTNPALPGASR